MKKIHKISLLGILTSLALVLHIIEAQIPVIVSIPGIKLGLANITTLFCLYTFGFPQALTVLLLRCLLGAFFSGQLTGFLYSVTGGLLSLLVMQLLFRRLPLKNLPLVSIIGAIFHNIGQIAVAVIITGTPGIAIYLPFLLLSGVVTGFMIGLLVYWLCIRLNKILSIKQQ